MPSSFQPPRTVVALQYVFVQLVSFRHRSTPWHVEVGVASPVSFSVTRHQPEYPGFESSHVTERPGVGEVPDPDPPRAAKSATAAAARSPAAASRAFERFMRLLPARPLPDAATRMA